MPDGLRTGMRRSEDAWSDSESSAWLSRISTAAMSLDSAFEDQLRRPVAFKLNVTPHFLKASGGRPRAVRSVFDNPALIGPEWSRQDRLCSFAS